MSVLIHSEVSKQGNEEIKQEGAATRLAGMAHENRQPRPYVVRDLSWELARYLDAETVSAIASASSNGANS